MTAGSGSSSEEETVIEHVGTNLEEMFTADNIAENVERSLGGFSGNVERNTLWPALCMISTNYAPGLNPGTGQWRRMFESRS